MNDLTPQSNVMNDEMMELVILGLLFVVIKDGRLQEMVNNTLLGVMPDLQLEDENGDATLLQNVIHGVVFVALWWVLGELKVRV